MQGGRKTGKEVVAVHELFPIAAGVLVGILAWRIASPRLRALTVVVLSVIFGTLASAISGELAISWEFLLIDMPLVFLSAAATAVLLLRWRPVHQTERR